MIKELEKKLHKEIPLTNFMQLKVSNYDENELVTTAPLDVNINDKGTAFGGSLATICIISGWSLSWLISKELGFDSNNIVINPVTKDIICYTKKSSKEQIEILKEKLQTKKSASIKIYSKIIEDNKVCVEFEGYYVIKI